MTVVEQRKCWLFLPPPPLDIIKTGNSIFNSAWLLTKMTKMECPQFSGLINLVLTSRCYKSWSHTLLLLRLKHIDLCRNMLLLHRFQLISWRWWNWSRRLDGHSLLVRRKRREQQFLGNLVFVLWYYVGRGENRRSHPFVKRWFDTLVEAILDASHSLVSTIWHAKNGWSYWAISQPQCV